MMGVVGLLEDIYKRYFDVYFFVTNLLIYKKLVHNQQQQLHRLQQIMVQSSKHRKNSKLHNTI
jgi:hypothetical protein